MVLQVKTIGVHHANLFKSNRETVSTRNFLETVCAPPNIVIVRSDRPIPPMSGHPHTKYQFRFLTELHLLIDCTRVLSAGYCSTPGRSIWSLISGLNSKALRWLFLEASCTGLFTPWCGHAAAGHNSSLARPLHNAKLSIFTIFTNSGSTHLVNAAYLAVLLTFVLPTFSLSGVSSLNIFVHLQRFLSKFSLYFLTALVHQPMSIPTCEGPAPVLGDPERVPMIPMCALDAITSRTKRLLAASINPI